MKNTPILITILLIILIGILTVLAVNVLGEETSVKDHINEYTYTKAICTDSYCQDYVIACKGLEIANIEPITGAVIDINSNWEDPRTPEQISTWCG